jgi:uncharacterized membrane protein
MPQSVSLADPAVMAPAPVGTRQRVPSVDLLRGLVMVVMALDHTRDFVNSAAMAYRPEDLTQTTAAIFMTRWVTHFCAPVFMFCAGLGAFFWLERRGSRSELSRFLWTRGLWLVVLELTVVRFAFFFDVDYSVVMLLVFWSLGLSMIALAGLVYLPFRALVAFSIGVIALHNLADSVQAASLGSAAWIWNVLHQPGAIAAGTRVVIVGYPLVPWIAVMALGFCFGRAYRLPAETRRRLLIRGGLAMTAAFVLLRLANVYGDPIPWNTQGTAIHTILSFLNTTKYPPSLLFLLMTLGPAIALLGAIDDARPGERNPLLVFGRVPLFYFVLHLALIHAVEVGLTWLRYGSQPFLFLVPPTLGSARDAFPADYGWSLGATYVVWIAVVAAMYPVCLWFSRVKRRRREWWISYL